MSWAAETVGLMVLIMADVMVAQTAAMWEKMMVVSLVALMVVYSVP